MRVARAKDRPEVWREIPGTLGHYQASSRGRVRRIYKTLPPKLLHSFVRRNQNGHGHTCVSVWVQGRQRVEPIIRLVAMAFFPGQVEGKNVMHRNGLHSDNTLENVLIVDDRQLGCRSGGRSRRKVVARIDGRGEIVEIYRSMTEASQDTGIARQTIRRHCEGLGTRPLPEGMSFRWEEDALWREPTD